MLVIPMVFRDVHSEISDVVMCSPSIVVVGLACVMPILCCWCSVHVCIPGHSGRPETRRNWPGMKDSGPCLGLTSGPPYQAWHDPFGRAQLGPMSPARHDTTWLGKKMI
jgi:hypothetical protein